MNLLVSICVVWACTSPAFADFRAGVEAYQRGNHMMAFQEFWTLAQEGHAGAQFNLGVLYATGLAVPQDFGQAARWYRLAAEHGHALAQCNLGVLYEAGKGGPSNDGKAIHWYRLAAEQGNPGGQNNLGRMYEEGRGVPRDSSETLGWYRKAAAQGNAQAQANLARLSAATSVLQHDMTAVHQ
jgi:TPR repeat protein